MEAEKPDISEIALQDLSARPFPVPVPRDYRIVMRKTAHDDIREHGRQDSLVEVCGVLVGEVYKDEQGPYLEIVGAIRGEHSTNQAGQVTFTHDTWSHISNVKDSQFPQLRIVGWYHTHPRFGIFLSPQDIFIHSSFFAEPWQVAFVFDPISEEQGFFIWERGTPFQVERFWVDGDIKIRADRKQDEGPSQPPPRDEPLPSSQHERTRGYFLAAGFVVLALLVVIGLFGINSKINSMARDQETNVRAESRSSTLLDSLKNSVDQIEIKLGSLLTAQNPGTPVDATPQQESRLEDRLAQIERGVKDLLTASTSSPIASAEAGENITDILHNDKLLEGASLRAVRKGGQVWCEGDVPTYRQKQRVEEALGGIEGVESVDTRRVSISHRYEIQPGDTLGSIAKRVYDNAERWGIIFEANRDKLRSPHSIQPSVVLTLPE